LGCLPMFPSREGRIALVLSGLSIFIVVATLSPSRFHSIAFPSWLTS
jgi:hypothetical protein